MAFWWRAVYDDGSFLEEVDGVSSEMIDRSKLARFELRHGAVDVLALEFVDRTKRLVFRRRTEIVRGIFQKPYCLVGWNGPNGVEVWRCDEEGRVAPEPDAGIQLIPCEVLS